MDDPRLLGFQQYPGHSHPSRLRSPNEAVTVTMTGPPTTVPNPPWVSDEGGLADCSSWNGTFQHPNLMRSPLCDNFFLAKEHPIFRLVLPCPNFYRELTWTLLLSEDFYQKCHYC